MINKIEKKNFKQNVFDWSLPNFCPELIEETGYKIPKYFKDDFFHKIKKREIQSYFDNILKDSRITKRNFDLNEIYIPLLNGILLQFFFSF